MKDKFFLVAIFAMFLAVLPFLASAADGGESPSGPDGPSQMGENFSAPFWPEGGLSEENDMVFHVFNISTGQAMELTGRDYILHVVAAEMPASFEREALKAQAVAAFTYAVYRKGGTPDNSHEGCELCTDSSHCKAYADDAYLRSLWGEDYNYYYSRVKEAVDEVYGHYMTYQGQPIAAVFHALSAGVTESAVNVWGHEYPYLVSVDSAWDKKVSGYETTVTVTEKEFKSIMRAYNRDCDLSDHPEEWVGKIRRSESGGVRTMEIGDLVLAGTRVRALFDLRSANFTVKYRDGTFTFTVHGYGHGVGMSQYGADRMAEEGATWQEILHHYYTDIDIDRAGQ